MKNLHKETFIQKEKIEEFKSWLRDNFQISEKTIELYSIVIQKFYQKNKKITQGILNKFLKENPRWYVKSSLKYWLWFKYGYKKSQEFYLKNPKEPERKIKDIPQMKELISIFNKIESKECNKEIKLIYRFLIMTGARIHEVLNLKVKNFDFKEQKVVFRTKGGRERKVKLTKDFMEKLKEWVIEKRGLLGEDIIFFNRCKTRRSAYYMLWYYLKKVGLSEKEIELFKRTHNFRRAMINYILELTNDNIFKAYNFIGHKNIDTTIAYVSEKKKEKSMEETFELLWGEK
ncbi:hypothetical protein DRQ26_00685 [bacterium]|nr:MAG: hypothetical protein DRQ26_00685 [bacterium]